MLPDNEFTVRTATSVADALDRLAAGDFDCVVSAYDVGDRDGIDFLEAVRERDAELPIVLYVSEGNEAVASEAIYAGVTDYVTRDDSTEREDVLANRVK